MAGGDDAGIAVGRQSGGQPLPFSRCADAEYAGIDPGRTAWHQLALTRAKAPGAVVVVARGKENNGKLTIPDQGPWQADIQYLYYNPLWPKNPAAGADTGQYTLFSDDDRRCLSVIGRLSRCVAGNAG